MENNFDLFLIAFIYGKGFQLNYYSEKLRGNIIKNYLKL